MNETLQEVLTWTVAILFLLAIFPFGILGRKIYLHSLLLQVLIVTAVLYHPKIELSTFIKAIALVALGFGILFEITRVRNIRDIIFGSNYEVRRKRNG